MFKKDLKSIYIYIYEYLLIKYSFSGMYPNVKAKIINLNKISN